MKVSAEVTVNNGTYAQWLEFFNSYKSKRSEFVRNEVIKQLSDTKVQIDFEIIDLEGLTALSAEPAITDEEERLGVVTIIK